MNVHEKSNCPVKLKKIETTQTSATRRSRSAPRGAESIFERSLNDHKIRENRIRQTKQQLEKEQKEKDKDSLPQRSKVKPVIRHKKADNVWDENGHLLIDPHSLTNGGSSTKVSVEEINNKASSRSKIDPHSKELVRRIQNNDSDENSYVPISERPPKRTRPRAQSVCSSSRRAPSVQSARSNFDDFLSRQNQTYQKRELVATEEINREKRNRNNSFTNKESEVILRKSNRQNSSKITTTMPKKKMQVKPNDEFTYMPDLSLTKNREARGLSCMYSEAQAVLKDIEVTAIKVELETEDLKECTFKPGTYDNSAVQESAKMNENKNKIRKETRLKNLLQESQSKEDQEMKPRKFMTKIPNRTKTLNKMLSQFKDNGENEDNSRSKYSSP